MKENDFITVLIYPPYSFYTYLHYNPGKEKQSYPAKILGWSKQGAKHPYISIIQEE